MSGNPTTPSNVVPMPTNWPGPSFMPKTWPPGGPSCFSELASLNACYDSIQMMNQILAKVITDLVTNDAAVQKAIVEAIAASGSNVPLIGVTNGADAQPGQVGESIQFSNNCTYPAATTNTQVVTAGTLPPGDWDVLTWFSTNNFTAGVSFGQTPAVAGFTPNEIFGVNITLGSSTDPNAFGGVVFGTPARALISVPTLLAFNLTTNVLNNAASSSTSGQLYTFCRRRR